MYLVKVSYTSIDGITGKEYSGTETIKVVEADNVDEACEIAEEKVYNREAMNYRISNFSVLLVTKKY